MVKEESGKEMRIILYLILAQIISYGGGEVSVVIQREYGVRKDGIGRFLYQHYLHGHCQ